MSYTAKPGRRSVVCVDVRPSKGTVIRWDLTELEAVDLIDDLLRKAAMARLDDSAVLIEINLGEAMFTDRIMPDVAVEIANGIADVLEAADAS